MTDNIYTTKNSKELILRLFNDNIYGQINNETYGEYDTIFVFLRNNESFTISSSENPGQYYFIFTNDGILQPIIYEKFESVADPDNDDRVDRVIFKTKRDLKYILDHLRFKVIKNIRYYHGDIAGEKQINYLVKKQGATYTEYNITRDEYRDAQKMVKLYKNYNNAIPALKNKLISRRANNQWNIVRNDVNNKNRLIRRNENFIIDRSNLPGDLAKRIARLSINSFGKNKKKSNISNNSGLGLKELILKLFNDHIYGKISNQEINKFDSIFISLKNRDQIRIHTTEFNGKYDINVFGMNILPQSIYDKYGNREDMDDPKFKSLRFKTKKEFEDIIDTIKFNDIKNIKYFYENQSGRKEINYYTKRPGNTNSFGKRKVRLSLKQLKRDLKKVS